MRVVFLTDKQKYVFPAAYNRRLLTHAGALKKLQSLGYSPEEALRVVRNCEKTTYQAEFAPELGSNFSFDGQWFCLQGEQLSGIKFYSKLLKTGLDDAEIVGIMKALVDNHRLTR